MECRFCQKAFHKGEHLRRHERSHTGIKPYVCKNCNRSFSRQDSLIRHEKLHTREAAEGAITPSSAQEAAATPSSAQARATGAASDSWSGSAAPIYNSPPLSSASEHAIPTNVGSDTTQYEHVPGTDTALLQDAAQSADLDFELIWPDSVDLYQTLMSQDASLQWHMPLGTLPYPSELPPQADNIGSYATPSSIDERVSSIGSIPVGGNDQALKDVRRMVVSSSNSVNAAIDGTSINSVFLDECLHMFFVKFIPTFPVLHRATFVFRDCTHPLLLNAIAIGSLYLGPKASIAKGEALWRLAHAAVATSWQTLITHCGPYDACEGVQLVITALLGQTYGALSKNRQIRTTSQATRALSFSWARRCGMFDSSANASTTGVHLIHASEAEKDHQWRLWIGKELQHRALLAHYVIDGLIAHMAGEPTSVRHAANHLGLPSNDAAFQANTADEWIHAMQVAERPSQLSFRSILHGLFSRSPSTETYNFSAFSLRVALEGIQSILSECDGEQDGIVGVPSRSEVRSALSRIHALIVSSSISTADRLETLLRWHGICLDAIVDTSALCKDLCARWNIEQHVWSTSKRNRSSFDRAPWASTENARRALLHAVAIQDIVETLPRGRAHAVHMPASLFAASTIYAAFALSEVITIKLVNEVDWRMVMDDTGVNDFSVWDTKRYIKGDGSYFGPTRNLVYELNSMHKLMGCLKTQWGIAHDMENVVEQWVTLCH